MQILEEKYADLGGKGKKQLTKQRKNQRKNQFISLAKSKFY